MQVFRKGCGKIGTGPGRLDQFLEKLCGDADEATLLPPRRGKGWTTSRSPRSSPWASSRLSCPPLLPPCFSGKVSVLCAWHAHSTDTFSPTKRNGARGKRKDVRRPRGLDPPCSPRKRNGARLPAKDDPSRCLVMRGSCPTKNWSPY